MVLLTVWMFVLTLLRMFRLIPTVVLSPINARISKSGMICVKNLKILVEMSKQMEDL